jgi:ABC-type transport system involved in cytochrome bd biosynthesis fused ATPase/permease subunit
VAAALARVVLLDDPDLLLLDEPTAGLDEPAREELLDALGALTRGRVTVLATRDPEVAAVADHRLWLDDGTSAAADLGPPLHQVNGAGS